MKTPIWLALLTLLTSLAGAGQTTDPKITADLKAIAKGDVKKMNALIAKGAEIDGPRPRVSNIEDVTEASGTFRFRIVDAAGPAQPMFTAIDSAQPEAVRTLLASKADIGTEFFWGASAGPIPIPLELIANTLKMGFGGTVKNSNGETLCCTSGPDGTVLSRIRPTPGHKVTFAAFAEEQLQAEKNPKRQAQLRQIIEMLNTAH